MKSAQVIDFESSEVKEAMVGVRAKTAANVGAGWWDRRMDADGVSRSVRGSRRRVLAADNDWANYHVMSRTVGGEIFFDEVEKEALKTLIWKMARFCRVRVLTYAVMGNHFHVLVEVPDKSKLVEEFSGDEGEQRLLTHVKCLYSAAAVRSLEAELKRMRDQGRHEDAKAVVDSVVARMGDLSCYMKEVKERFTRWYNKRHGRCGTLWMDRFKSVLVEDGEALRTMAQYIDLNPVRAGLVNDPMEYRWCGWSEALAGSRRAKRGICRVMDCALDSWERGRTEARKHYAAALGEILRGEAVVSSKVASGLEADGGKSDGTENVEKLVRQRAAGGQSVTTSATSGSSTDARDAKPRSVRGLLLHRVRYFTDGVVIGSQGFVEAVFKRNRGQFPEGRKYASRPWRDPGGGGKRAEFGLHSLRDLRVDVYGGP